MKIRPLHDRVVAKRVAEVGKTSGGLFIPDNAKENPWVHPTTSRSRHCGIDAAVMTVGTELKKLSLSTKGKSEIAQVGIISANGDETIGTLIAEAMAKVERRKPRRWTRRSRSRACSSIAATCHRTS